MSGLRAWHVVNRDGTTREVTEASLRDLIGRGSVSRRTLVWTFGMADWEPAGQLLRDWFPQEERTPASRGREGNSQSAPVASSVPEGRGVPSTDPGQLPPRPPRRSYIARHWRGELPLATSYWVNGFLVLGVLAVARAGILSFDLTAAPRLLTGAIAGLGLFAIAASVWQVVGVWRSSGRALKDHRRRGKMGLWAILARLSAGLGFLSVIGHSLVYTLPGVWANLQIALGEDPTPRHVLKLVNRGTEVEISGGIDFGTAAELETLLKAAPAVRVVDLASPGGRVAEAEHVRDFIRARRLATYTDADCASACTIVYMGGDPRYIGPGGKLGFHRYSFPGLTPDQDDEANREGQQDLIRSGVDANFAAKAFSTSSEQIWVPDRPTLLSAHVVTKEVDGTTFSAAAIASGPVTTEQIDKEIAPIADFAALKRADPAAYGQVVALMLAGIENGGSVEEVMNNARRPLTEAVARFRPFAADEVQVQLAAITAEEARLLAPQHPDLCIEMLYGTSPDIAVFAKLFPKDIKNREIDLAAAIIDSGFSQPSRPVLGDQEAEAEINRLWEKVQSQGVDISTLGKQAVTTDDQRSTCLAMAAFMWAIVRLPDVTAGPLMRYLATHP